MKIEPPNAQVDKVFKQLKVKGRLRSVRNPYTKGHHHYAIEDEDGVLWGGAFIESLLIPRDA